MGRRIATGQTLNSWSQNGHELSGVTRYLKGRTDINNRWFSHRQALSGVGQWPDDSDVGSDSKIHDSSNEEALEY